MNRSIVKLLNDTDTFVYQMPVLAETTDGKYRVTPSSGVVTLCATNSSGANTAVTVKVQRFGELLLDTVSQVDVEANSTVKLPSPISLAPADKLFAICDDDEVVTISGSFVETQNIFAESLWVRRVYDTNIGHTMAWCIATNSGFGADVREEHGGFFGGLVAVNQDEIPTRALIVSPASFDDTTYQWATATGESDPADPINGALNTQQLIDKNGTNGVTYPAAMRVNTINTTGGINGFTDWYLPARYELQVLYWNLKPTTTVNDDRSFFVLDRARNPYSIPKVDIFSDSNSVNFPTQEGPPIQTLGRHFRSGGSEAFVATGYWSSTQANTNNAWRQLFNIGFINLFNKSNSNRVRAVRGLII